MKILIINAHWDNRGDEAAIRAMIDSLKNYRSDLKINLMLLTKSVYSFPYKDVELLKPFPYLYFDNKKEAVKMLIKTMIDMLLLISSSGKIAFSEDGRRFAKEISDSDLVIHSPGGPNIGDIYNSFSNDLYLFRIYIAMLAKKPVFFYAPSMGPFNSKLRKLFRKYLLRKAVGIVVRDQISERYLKEQLGLTPYVAYDSALQYDPPEDYLEKYSESRFLLDLTKKHSVIGIVITDLAWHPKYKTDVYKKQNIRESMSIFVNYLTKRKYVVLLIPQLFGNLRDIGILSEYEKNDRVYILSEHFDAYAQQLIIKNLFCVISMRYHPIIFAAKYSVPFISIYYEHKAKSFVESIDRSDLLLNVEELTPERLINLFSYLEANHEKIKKEMKSIEKKIRSESKKINKILFYIINNKIPKSL